MLYQVKLGILGLEFLGKAHASLLKEHVKSLTLIAAAGRTQEELLFAKNDLSLEYVYSDDKALIENHDIDAVAIFSPPSLRPHQTVAAIEAGKHVFVADPIALNVEDASAVHRCALSHPSQVVMASSQVRFHPLMKAIKGTVGNRDIGVVNQITVDASFFGGWSRVSLNKSGSNFIDRAIDEIDFCLWILGDYIKSVQVTEDDNSILCKGTTSKDAGLEICIQKDLKKQGGLKISGDEGHIVMSNTYQRSFTLFENNGDKREVRIDDNNGFGFPEYLQLHHFTQSILHRQKRISSTKNAVEVVRMAVAFEKSAALSQSVILV